MSDLHLEVTWDANKARTNERKHGVSFTLAASAMHDPLALTVPDVEHSSDNARWLTIGLTPSGDCLIVAHTWEDLGANKAKARFISARHATRAERRWYEEQ